ncbi:uncharacterized protein METZ01_LOCUS150997 [marine metagenome]|uniref:Uncharacterized protein n=1 Tax=marine metagenome TaxID=408172 RepID=A0A382AB13_9ZZZZ
MNNDHRHHTNYVSEQQLIHKCVLTYFDIFTNMPLQWYVQNVYDSVNRKGYTISYKDVEFTVAYFLKDKLDFCPHCFK